MKIAHIVPSLIPGGAERVTVMLARAAVESGHSVRLFVGWPDENDRVLRDAVPSSVPVEHVFSRRRSKWTSYAAVALWVYRNRRRLAEYDIVHCHLTFASAAGAVLSKVRRGRRPGLVETYHSVTATLSPLHVTVHRAFAACRDALALHADDASWRPFAVRHPRILFRTIQNGAEDPRVDLVGEEDRLAYRRGLGIPDDCVFVVGTVGRLESDRRPTMYIPIFAEISRQLGPRVHFVLAGGGPARSEVESLVSIEGMSDRVHITGAFPYSRVPLSIMDAYVAMNLGPTTGLAGLEATLAGVPSVGIQLDESHKVSAEDWMWSSSDPHAVAERIVSLLRDPAVRRECAVRQQQHVGQHRTIAAMWLEYERLYEEVLR